MTDNASMLARLCDKKISPRPEFVQVASALESLARGFSPRPRSVVALTLHPGHLACFNFRTALQVTCWLCFPLIPSFHLSRAPRLPCRLTLALSWTKHTSETSKAHNHYDILGISRDAAAEVRDHTTVAFC